MLYIYKWIVKKKQRTKKYCFQNIAYCCWVFSLFIIIISCWIAPSTSLSDGKIMMPASFFCSFKPTGLGCTLKYKHALKWAYDSQGREDPWKRLGIYSPSIGMTNFMSTKNLKLSWFGSFCANNNIYNTGNIPSWKRIYILWQILSRGLLEKTIHWKLWKYWLLIFCLKNVIFNWYYSNTDILCRVNKL